MHARIWMALLVAGALAALAVALLAPGHPRLAAAVAGLMVLGAGALAARLATPEPGPAAEPRAATSVKSIYVGNLPFQAREGELRALFERCGKVRRVRIIRDPETRRSKGFAFVDMDPEGARRALAELDGCELRGRKLRLGPAERDG